MHSRSELATQNLKKYWGFDQFRPGQDKVVEAVLSGKNVMVLFPTGGGKSLCYQVPATVMDGLTIVISPLVALMQDQVKQLTDRGIKATFINSTLSSREIEQRLVNARNGMYKLLYCSPERLHTPLFQYELPDLNIKLVAVDEAHCISEWGHDFRPSYRQISEAFETVHDSIQWIALTATATPEVKKDIIQNLKLEEAEFVSKGFQRPNLNWWVTQAENTRTRMVQAVRKASGLGDGLIYAGTRRNCEHWASQLTKQGIRTKSYHAGIPSRQRKIIQEEWISGETPLVAATNAFGMGIDKPDCRYVIHQEMPFSLEAYYQEAGRAGRDGGEGYPLLFYKPADYTKARKRIEQNYPGAGELGKVYDVMCDELSLALGSGMEQMKPFDPASIPKRSGLPSGICRSALRLLQQFEVITMTADQPEMISIRFLLSRDAFENMKHQFNNPQKAEFADQLYRLFGHGAYEEEVEHELEMVLRKFEITENSLIKALNVFMLNDHILHYTLHTSNTRIRLNDPRSRQVPVDMNLIQQFRKVLLKKLDHMHGYIQTTGCREVYLRTYFGETNVSDCGHCDNCTQKKAAKTERPDQESVREIYTLLTVEQYSVDEIRSKTGIDRAVIESGVHYLTKEGRIKPDHKNRGQFLRADSTES